MVSLREVATSTVAPTPGVLSTPTKKRRKQIWERKSYVRSLFGTFFESCDSIGNEKLDRNERLFSKCERNDQFCARIPQTTSNILITESWLR